MMQYKSKTQRISGLVIGVFFIVGLIGLGAIFVTGFKNNPFYWNSLWIMMGVFSIGLIGARIHGIIWGKK